MDLSLLRTFLAVYRCGSFTGAAPQLGLSQPTVTAQIRAMEAQLGQQLFRRMPRGVAPTSIADELAGQVAKHVDALSTIAERGLAPADPFAAPVHLAGPVELTTARVLPALAGLVGRGLKLRVTFGLADELLSGLDDRRFDLVVSTIRPHGRSLSVTPLTDEEFVLVAGRSWASKIDADQLARDPLATLKGVPLVAYAEELPIIRRYWRSVFGAKPKGSPAVVVPDLRGVLAGVLAGFGITVLPRYLCAGSWLRANSSSSSARRSRRSTRFSWRRMPLPSGGRISRPCAHACSRRPPGGERAIRCSRRRSSRTRTASG